MNDNRGFCSQRQCTINFEKGGGVAHLQKKTKANKEKASSLGMSPYLAEPVFWNACAVLSPNQDQLCPKRKTHDNRYAANALIYAKKRKKLEEKKCKDGEVIRLLWSQLATGWSHSNVHRAFPCCEGDGSMAGEKHRDTLGGHSLW